MIFLYYLIALILFPIMSFFTAAIFHQLIGLYSKLIDRNNSNDLTEVNIITKIVGYCSGSVSTILIIYVIFDEKLVHYFILPMFFLQNLYRRNSENWKMEPVESTTIIALTIGLLISYFIIWF